MPTCFFKENFNIICPFCGGSRFFFNLITFHFVEAFKYHPTTFLYTFFLGAIIVIYIYEKNVNKPHKITLDLFVHSFYIYLIVTFIQYVIRLLLIANNIEVPFIYTNI